MEKLMEDYAPNETKKIVADVNVCSYYLFHGTHLFSFY